MKLRDILEGDVSYSLMDRMKARDDFRDQRADVSAEVKSDSSAKAWFDQNVQPLITRFFKTRVFGFKNVSELHEFISDIIYSGASDSDTFDTSDPAEFREQLDGMRGDQDTIRRLEAVRNGHGELAILSREILNKLQEWHSKFGAKGGRTFRSLSAKLLHGPQSENLVKWEQTARWLSFLRDYFPKRH